MQIIFCADPFDSRQPDAMYQVEAEAVRSLELDYSLISFEALINEANITKAIRRVPQQEKRQLGMYRGWMMPPEAYEELYKALLDKGVELINSPVAYAHCHYLPNSYPVIKDYTPSSVWMLWMGELLMDEIMSLLEPFGDRAVIVKDFVKSQKHYWNEACYIPRASDKEAVQRVVERFIELQGDTLSEGLVFREFIEFEPLTKHSKSGMPLTKEFRLFVLDGEPFFASEYWEEGDYAGVAPPIEEFRLVAREVKSRFFTMDIAKRKDGDWMIIELGEGQVAGLPENSEAEAFYRGLVNRLEI